MCFDYNLFKLSWVISLVDHIQLPIIMKKLITITILLLSLIRINAQTTVNSYNANDSVWEKSNSPYYITGEITVPTNNSLTIEPGVKVIFKGNYNVIIYGNFKCIGTTNNMIEIKGDSLSPTVNVLWDRIQIYQSKSFFSSERISIEYCIIKNGKGFYFNNFLYVNFLNCKFYNNFSCINSNKSGSDSVVNSIFENNSIVFKSDNLNIVNSVVKNNGYVFSGPATINLISNCLIEENEFMDQITIFKIENSIIKDFFCKSQNCVGREMVYKVHKIENSILDNSKYLYLLDLKIISELKNTTIRGYKKGVFTNASSSQKAIITGNVFISNYVGVELSSLNSLSNTVTCNKFINNRIGLKYSQNQQDLVQNNYFCNYEYDVVNTSSQSQNLTQNYFCSDSIENKIYEKSDLNSLGAINYNLYNPSLQSVIKVVAKEKSILTAFDTTAPIDTACVSKRSYFDIALNTKDTICHQFNTVYISVQPTVLNSTYPINQISLTKTNPVNGPVNVHVQGLYIEEYKATDPSGNFVTKRRYILVKTNCTSAQTLFIDLNTPDTVCHKVNTPYNSVIPTVYSTIYPNTQLNLQLISSSIDPNVKGTYIEEFKAMDPSGTTVFKRRFVRVSDTCGINTSNKSVFSNGFNIYPNPCQNVLNIITTSEKEIKVTLMDAVGKMIEEWVYSGSLFYTIDTKNYINGAYFIRIEIDNQIWANKVIISH